MANANRDSNRVKTLLGITDDANQTPTQLIVDPTTKRLKVSAIITSGGGITSINGVTTGSQSLITGSSGTDFTIGHGTYHTFNLPDASAANRGLLLSADWSAFNNKVGTSRTIATSSPLAGGGDLSANRTFSLAGLTGVGTAHWLVGVNPAGTEWEYKNINAGTSIGLSKGTNDLTIGVSGLAIGSNIQAWDADLDALAALSGTGFSVRTSADLWVQREFLAGTNVAISQGDGVAGNPTIGVITNPTFSGLVTASVGVTSGGTTIFNTGAVFDGEVANGNSGTNFTINWGTGNKQSLTLTGSPTLTFVAPAGATNLLLRLVQSNGAGYNLVYPTAVKISGGTALTTGTNAQDIVSLYYNPTSGSYLGMTSTNFV